MLVTLFKDVYQGNHLTIYHHNDRQKQASQLWKGAGETTTGIYQSKFGVTG